MRTDPYGSCVFLLHFHCDDAIAHHSGGDLPRAAADLAILHIPLVSAAKGVHQHRTRFSAVGTANLVLNVDVGETLLIAVGTVISTRVGHRLKYS